MLIVVIDLVAMVMVIIVGGFDSFSDRDGETLAVVGGCGGNGVNNDGEDK